MDVPKCLHVSPWVLGRGGSRYQDSLCSNPSLRPSVSQQTMQFPNLVFCLRSSKERNRGSGTSRTWRRARSLPMPPQVRWQLSARGAIGCIQRSCSPPRLSVAESCAWGGYQEEPCIRAGKVWLIRDLMSRYSSTYKPGQAEPGELGTRSRQQGKDLQPAQVLREPVCPARKENRVLLGKSIHPKNPLHPLWLCGWCLGLSLEHHPSRAGKPGIRAGIWGAEGFLQGHGWERGTRDPESRSNFCSEIRGADKEIRRCPRRDGVSSAAGLWPWATDTGSL